MDLKQIEKLMMAMRRYGTKRLALKKEGFEIELERECELNKGLLEATIMQVAKEEEKGQFHLPKAETVLKKKELEGESIESPMVGTFYLSQSPKDPPYIKVGDRVDENSVVCIIEAMKVMNEIKSGVAGVVKEVLVEDGHPVEFGTKLFRIES